MRAAIGKVLRRTPKSLLADWTWRQKYNTVIFKLITEGWRRDGEAGDGGRESVECG